MNSSSDIVISKIASIQRCVKRAREELAAADDFAHDYTHQDAAILNVTRSCEQAIDLANHMIRRDKLGIPKDSGDTFDLLATRRLIGDELSRKLKKMVGFRNIAVHEYQDIDIEIVRSVIRDGLDDLLAFTDRVLEWDRQSE
jgi:uncharacterized protein YutE (UPF0331/DUF86 family)